MSKRKDKQQTARYNPHYGDWDRDDFHTPGRRQMPGLQVRDAQRESEDVIHPCITYYVDPARIGEDGRLLDEERKKNGKDKEL